jgi:hypothetical protein
MSTLTDDGHGAAGNHQSPRGSAVSRPCSKGKHTRCLGTVHVYPPVDGKPTVPCECPTPDCGHGTAIQQARGR